MSQMQKREENLMKMTRILLGVAALLSFGLGACEPKSTIRKPLIITKSKRKELKAYYPIQVGDRRVYNIRFSGSKKTIQRTIKITHKQGERFFDDQNSNYKFDTYGLRSDRKRYLLKYPLRKGLKWLSVTSVTTVERYEILNTNRTITVPAGTYTRCVVVRSQKKIGPQGLHEAYFYYAPRIGPVKIATVINAKGRQIPQWTLELVSYQPGKR